MAEVHRDPYSGDRVVVHKSRRGLMLAVIVVLILAVVGILFATGFWKADVRGGDMPEVSVKGGELPKVDVDSKGVVVGTKKETIDVLTVGVKDNGEE